MSDKPKIPLPEPLFVIEVTRGSARQRRATVRALRVLLWLVPPGAADYFLATADGGRHALWAALAATYVIMAIAVLTVDARDGGDGA